LLEKDGKRTATVIADNTTYLGVLCQTDFTKYIKKTEKQNFDTLIDFISSIPYFAALSKTAIAKIVNSLNRIQTVRGQHISYEDFSQFAKLDQEG
jgi:hypothetical protein